VLNDLGVGPDGHGALVPDAEQAAREIVDAGGEAIADIHSVSGSDSARAVVQTALDAWGRVDILVNNAGVSILSYFDELSDADCELIARTHLLGHIWMCRAVWPHMKAASYGRIVNISSNASFGLPYLATYGAAKAGVAGLAIGLALEGSRSGIKVNALAPIARTAKHDTMMSKQPASIAQQNTVEQVAPAVAYLCHQDCAVTGKFFFASGGKVQEYVYAQTAGYAEPEPTIESVRDNLGRIVDRTGAVELVPLDDSAYDRMTPTPYVPR
jgi:NAD(P)-dependent dehydrogenase (short-subunit alcohol dehydrogenase family)